MDKVLLPSELDALNPKDEYDIILTMDTGVMFIAQLMSHTPRSIKSKFHVGLEFKPVPHTTGDYAVRCKLKYDKDVNVLNLLPL